MQMEEAEERESERKLMWKETHCAELRKDEEASQEKIAVGLQSAVGGEDFFRQTNVFENNASRDFLEEPGLQSRPDDEERGSPSIERQFE